MDNASIHKSAEVRALYDGFGVRLGLVDSGTLISLSLTPTTALCFCSPF